ncbi:cytochrome c oxidase assembly protein [Pseudoduganella plicata]|uniref:Cytochrome c oxidase assembly protein CtaG n=1 Tax=Pseudoduganella plicata TaxID=321984 RepID=A0A4P7BKT7_9BURK|nr:cytochrome c oxidase assembly protein [Pseudoduganella plicata]QBQ38325.1 cytochrome c oxidase assembly protein [Pseudoduganella plicata]GGY81227.1 cytochrome c oxidase assembly protein [Pseudoduganella plicata]
MNDNDPQEGRSEERDTNRKMLGKLVVVAVAMFGFGYALIPVYRHICEVLGINVLTQKDGTVAPPKNTQVDMSRSITVELDSNVQGTLRFRPTQRSITVHPGEMATVVYEVVNSQARPVTAQAIPSYAPQSATPHFKKVECFCFQQQTLQANEAKQMPVVFFLDPALPKEVKTITLSYTFIEIAGVNKTAAAPGGVVR